VIHALKWVLEICKRFRRQSAQVKSRHHLLVSAKAEI